MSRLNFSFFFIHQVCVVFLVSSTPFCTVCVLAQMHRSFRGLLFLWPVFKTAASSHHYFIPSLILGNLLKTSQSGLHVLLCSFFLSQSTFFFSFLCSWPHNSLLSLSSYEALFLTSFHEQWTNVSFVFFFKLLLVSGKTSKMHTHSRGLFCLCVAVVCGLLFTSTSLAPECVAYLWRVLYKASWKDCTLRESQCTKMQGGYGSPFYMYVFCHLQSLT